MGSPYSDHPVYQAMAAILAQPNHPEAKTIDLSLSYAGPQSIGCGLHPGFSDGTFVIGASSRGSDDSPEIYFVEECYQAARQLAAALSAWADWDEAKYMAVFNGSDSAASAEGGE